MIVIMHRGAKESSVLKIEELLHSQGIRSERLTGEKQTVIAIIGPTNGLDISSLATYEDVQDVVRVSNPYRLVHRTATKTETIITFPDGTRLGGDNPTIMMAGPCSVESEQQLYRTAELIRKSGVRFLRGGAFKPRTSPYSFQGLGFDGLELLRKAADEFGMFVVTEVMEPGYVPKIAEYADVLQVGARNMQNFPLLRQLGTTNKPVLLKRSAAATIEEWLLAAEYIVGGGNDQVILCERGIRTFEPSLRYTPDISAIPIVKKLSHLPVIFDPSHSTGKRDYVAPMSRAALAAGADGLLVEVHPDPNRALSDGAQALTFEMFEELMGELVRIGDAIDRPLLVEPYEASQKPKTVKSTVSK
jgi:3-deoxy-7-phosphoheptulonate synthase